MTPRQRITRSHVSFAFAILAVLSWTNPALAQDDATKRQKFEDTIHVIQRKPVLEEGRVEASPRFGTSINDSIYRSFKAGLSANYHIGERLYAGALFEWFDFGTALGGPTKAFEKSFSQTDTAPDAPVVQWFGAAEAGYIPIYGKFALFNQTILYYTIGASLGAGALNAGSITTDPSTTFGGTASLNSRLFFNDWMALDLELRDLFFQAKLRNGREKKFANIVTVAGGVSFYFPTTFEYSKPEQQQKSK